jgi:sporulation protein YlmC with PRC-barrel domain
MRLTDENIRGRAIIAADGQVVGEVTALFLDSETWLVESLQAELGNDIADQIEAERSMFHAGTLEIPVRLVQSVGDTIVLSTAVDGLRDVVPKHSDSEGATA